MDRASARDEGRGGDTRAGQENVIALSHRREDRRLAGPDGVNQIATLQRRDGHSRFVLAVDGVERIAPYQFG